MEVISVQLGPKLKGGGVYAAFRMCVNQTLPSLEVAFFTTFSVPPLGTTTVIPFQPATTGASEVAASAPIVLTAR